MQYRQGRYNLAATIFVPWDCDNNCPFCTSKASYQNCQNFNLYKVLESICLLNKKDEIKEFVITGGEPFADIDGLKKIINCCDKPVYINTTLPSKTFEQAKDLINSTDIIKGINVSRHIGYEFKNIATVEDLDLITKPIRINTVLSNSSITLQELVYFIQKYGKKKRDINIREDYRYTSLDTLKSRSRTFMWLAEIFDYLETESCMVCNSDYFSVGGDFICAYHRGLQSSRVWIGDKCYVNDVIVAQDGRIHSDWGSTLQDPDFIKWIKGEK